MVELTMALKESKNKPKNAANITKLWMCKRRGHHHHRSTLTYMGGVGPMSFMIKILWYCVVGLVLYGSFVFSKSVS